MDRDQLILQVKSEYARLADLGSSATFTDQSDSGVSTETYFERSLEKAIADISAGKYDNCMSGLEVVEQIANHKTKSRLIQDTIKSTLLHMEIADELIASSANPKMVQRLKADNERRAEAIPKMFRTMKQEQAREQLESDSPNVIGGGNGS